MKKETLHLIRYGKSQLWTREFARKIREELNKILDELKVGDTLIIDAEGIEVFDYSFANELFGKTIISLASEYPGRFVIVENLTDYCRENLSKALESLNLIMIEKKDNDFKLIGDVHPADQETFHAVLKSKKAVIAAELKDKLGINVTAMNERLSKLTKLALVRRESVVSPAGRQQYQYHIMT